MKTKDLARAYFDAVVAGHLPDSLLTEDMSAWTTMGGDTDKDTYNRMIASLRAACPEHLEFTIVSLTAEDDRVVAEAQSRATLLNGESYGNTYIFVFRVRDGRIAHIAEHFNPLIVQEKLIPAIRQLGQTEQ